MEEVPLFLGVEMGAERTFMVDQKLPAYSRKKFGLHCEVWGLQNMLKSLTSLGFKHWLTI